MARFYFVFCNLTAAKTPGAQNHTFVRLFKWPSQDIIRHITQSQALQTMKINAFLVSASITLALSSAMAQSTYNGPGVADGSAPADGGAISSVVVNNNATSISFTINSTETMASYIFYSVELQIVGQAGSGYTGFANPWNPQVGISTGENALINTYGSGGTPGIYSGSWAMGSGVSYTAGGTGFDYATITLPLSSLGLSLGDSFYFDVVSSYTTPSGQAAYGALDNTGYLPESDNNYTPWNGTSYYDSATSPGTTFGNAATLYTVVPEPATCTLMGLGTLVLVRRMFRQPV
jgi:hypothetical protein